MKYRAFIIALIVIFLVLPSCIADDGRSKILRDDEAMNAYVQEMGMSDEQKLVVKKPYNRALDCDVYLV